MDGKKLWIYAICTIGAIALGCDSESAIKGDAGGGVTKCETAADCENPAFPICENGVCVEAKGIEKECKEDADCKNASKPICSELGTCIAEGATLECTTDSDCKKETKPECSAVGTCVPRGTVLNCTRDTDCTVEAVPVCSAVGTCIARDAVLECSKDTDCKDYTKPVCGLYGKCEAIDKACDNNDDCDSGMVCLSGKCGFERICNLEDSDGDTIADIYEGRDFDGKGEHRDTDGDTVPDYLDLDSDGDTIPDSVEGMTDGCSGQEPIDSDGDMVPDFQSLDSDGNGIPDMYEGCPMEGFVYIGRESPKKDKTNPEHICQNPVDTDGDTIPDYRSNDNDGDGISDSDEIVGTMATAEDARDGRFGGDCDGDGIHDPVGSPENPIDCDGDTIPDYMDEDSDGDTIPDRVEGMKIVTDVYARYSQDADGDGLLDKDEAGEDPLHPRDTDGDTIPDYLDLDSDGDGLSDKWEHEHSAEGYDPYKEDSDGDGANDLVEFGAGTNPGDPNDNPKSRGNFVFITPYQGTTTPERETLSFETSIQIVDIYFSIDQSSTMHKNIDTLQKELPQLLSDLQCEDLGKDCSENKDCTDLNGGNAICSEKKRCIVSPKVGPNGEGCFSDMYTGVGWWGNLDDFRNGSSLAEGAETTVQALKNKPNLGGGYENCIQPSICALYGSQFGCSKASCYAGSDRFGCVGFRKGAIKLYVQAGDAENNDAKGRDFTISNAKKWADMLKAEKVRYVGLWGSLNARDGGMKQLACFAGSCPSGDCAEDCLNMSVKERDTLYISSLTGENIRSATKSALLKLSKEQKIQVTTEVVDIDPGAAALIDRLEVNTSENTVHNRICTKVDASKIVSQQYPMINDLHPGTPLCFDVIPKNEQDVIQAVEEPKVYKARVNVLGDGSILNSGIAYFLVPGVIKQEIVN